MMGDENGKLP